MKTIEKKPRTPENAAFAKQLKFAMDQRRYTPVSLATAAGISSTATRNYLLGQFLPRGAVLERLQEILGFRFNLGDPSVFVPEETAPEEIAVQAEPVPLRLTIAEAKIALARSHGVDPSNVQITISG